MKRRGKNATTKKSRAKNRNPKINRRKKQPSRVPVRRKSSTRKTKAPNSSRKSRSTPQKTRVRAKPKTTVRVRADRTLWKDRSARLKRGTKAVNTRAVYSTISLRSGHKGKPSAFFPTVGSKFKVRKKSKQLDAIRVPSKKGKKLSAEKRQAHRDQVKSIKRGAASFLKLKKGERLDEGKGVYIKIAYRDHRGKLGFASVPRHKVFDRSDLFGAINAAILHIKGYGDCDIVGYEIEEVL